MGRLSFVCGAIIRDRPFLAPLYSLAAAVRKKNGGKVDTMQLPPYVKVIHLDLTNRLKAWRKIHFPRVRPRHGTSIERFTSDAKAYGNLVTIGGYQSHDATGRRIRHMEAKWFYVKLDRAPAPWHSPRANRSER